MKARSKLWQQLKCLVGFHWWTYEGSIYDHLHRPVLRHCRCCSAKQERRYSGYEKPNGFGPWKHYDD